jgi:hypothetical protein
MPKLEIKVTHELTQSEALTRIKKFLPELKAQHSDQISDLEESWSSNTGNFIFKIKGFKVSGNLVVGESDVLIKGNIPLIALPFKNTIGETIRTQAKNLLSVK